jgi:hypothetical protein
MCIACELQFLLAMEDVPPSTGTASHDEAPAEEVPRFACDVPASPPTSDERKPIVTSRE